MSHARLQNEAATASAYSIQSPQSTSRQFSSVDDQTRVGNRKKRRLERSLGSGSSDARHRKRVRDEHQAQYEEAQDGSSGDQQRSVVRLRVAVDVAHQELKPREVCGDDARVGARYVEERVEESPEEDGQSNELQTEKHKCVLQTRALGYKFSYPAR
jgi:hypothetical protein